MRFPLRQLLKDVDKVDDAEEVAPRKVGDELDLVVVACFRRAGTSAWRFRFEHSVFGSRRVERGRVDPVVAVLEEAGAQGQLSRKAREGEDALVIRSIVLRLH